MRVGCPEQVDSGPFGPEQLLLFRPNAVRCPAANEGAAAPIGSGCVAGAKKRGRGAQWSKWNKWNTGERHASGPGRRPGPAPSMYLGGARGRPSDASGQVALIVRPSRQDRQERQDMAVASWGR